MQSVLNEQANRHMNRQMMTQKQYASLMSKELGAYRVRTRIFFSFTTIFANLIFFVPFSLTEPDFEPNFGHFSPKNYLVRKKGVHLLIPLIAAVDSRISIV